MYADEGMAETRSELDTITLPEIRFDPNMDLDNRFHDLALIGMTHQSTKTTLEQKPAEMVFENYHLENRSGRFVMRDQLVSTVTEMRGEKSFSDAANLTNMKITISKSNPNII